MKQVLNPNDAFVPDKAHYLQSLLHYARERALLSGGELARIQQQFASLLANRALSVTRGKSSSVTVETAVTLAESAVFCAGLALRREAGINAQLALLKSTTLEVLHQNGQRLAGGMLLQARLLHYQAKTGRLATTNIAYNQSLDIALPDFFTDYDIHRSAHDIPALLDYPLANSVSDCCGVEYIRDWLQRLLHENAFCALFPADEITALCRSHHPGFKHLLINIGKLILANAFANALLGKSPLRLRLSEQDLRTLDTQLRNNIRSSDLDSTLDTFISGLPLNNPCKNYYRSVARTLASEIRNGLRHDCLNTVFTVDSPNSAGTTAIFEDNPRMNDRRFRVILRQITECADTNARLTIIRNRIRSLSDLIDVLGSGCFCESELPLLFDTLEISVLAQLSGNLAAPDELHLSEHERQWQSACRRYLAQLTEDKRCELEKLCGDWFRRNCFA